MEKKPEKDDLEKSEPQKKPSAEINQTENRKKVVVNELTNSVITNLPPELAEMLKAARQVNNSTSPAKVTPVIIGESGIKKETIPEATKKPSAEINQTENRKKVVVNELTNSVITNLPPELAEMLQASRQVNNKSPKPPLFTEPPPPPPAKIISNTNELVIYENGSIFGLQVSSTSRKDVLERMKQVSKINISNPGESIFKYDDLGIVFYFGEGGSLQEITFSYPFPGKTSKGLSLDDSIQKAEKIYGHPKMKTQAGAIWDKFAVFLRDDNITTIRLRSS